MNDDERGTYRRWQAAEQAEDDEAADAAFAGVYAASMPAPQPSDHLLRGTMRAVAADADARFLRRRRARAAIVWLGVPAAALVVHFGAGLLALLLSRVLVGTLNLLVSVVLLFAEGSDTRQTIWSVLTGVGRATAALVDDPRVTLAMLVCQAMAVAALVALHRLLGSGKGVVEMKMQTASLMLAMLVVAAAGAQELRPEDRELRSEIAERYDVVLLTDAVALRPKEPMGDVRLIEISDTISINGVPVAGRELRDRVGGDAEAVLKLSYLDPAVRRALFPPVTPALPDEAQPAPDRVPAQYSDSGRHRAGGDRVRIFGDVEVREDEELSGEVVAVMGSVRVDGKVRDQVVAVFGSVDLGDKAEVGGDVISVGGRVRRAPGAQVRGGITDVSFAGGVLDGHVLPWAGAFGLASLFDGFGAVPKLVGTMFRLLLLLFFVSMAMIVARPWVEGSAQRVSDGPVKVTVIGLVAEAMFLPVLLLTCILLALSVVGIPLLLLVPFLLLFLLLLALVGFTGAALAVGQWARRRFRVGSPSGFADLWIGVVVILLPVLVGRLVGLAGFLGGPFAFLLVATGLAIEFLVWATGFGAVLTNMFSRWQARRVVRTQAPVGA